MAEKTIFIRVEQNEPSGLFALCGADYRQIREMDRDLKYFNGMAQNGSDIYMFRQTVHEGYSEYKVMRFDAKTGETTMVYDMGIQTHVAIIGQADKYLYIWTFERFEPENGVDILVLDMEHLTKTTIHVPEFVFWNEILVPDSGTYLYYLIHPDADVCFLQQVDVEKASISAIYRNAGVRGAALWGEQIIVWGCHKNAPQKDYFSCVDPVSRTAREIYSDNSDAAYGATVDQNHLLYLRPSRRYGETQICSLDLIQPEPPVILAEGVIPGLDDADSQQRSVWVSAGYFYIGEPFGWMDIRLASHRLNLSTGQLEELHGLTYVPV